MVKKVLIESDALEVCMVHALSTEKEEVMGLLIGEVEDNISHIHAVIMLRRLDKRKDRVEISPEQLSSASSEAEDIGFKTRAQKSLRIIGWYHSHPHITVWPSHVDVRTQAMYQLMDKDFVGLIISCFNENTSHLGQMQVTCFQSIDVSSTHPPRYERLEIPQEIIPCNNISGACLQSLSSLPQILYQEEFDSYNKSLRHDDQDLLTAVQNASVFSKSIIRIIEMICSPILQILENNLQMKKKKVEELKNRHDCLEKQLANILGEQEKR